MSQPNKFEETRLKLPTPVEGSLCIFAQQTEDLDTLTNMMIGQIRRGTVNQNIHHRYELRARNVGRLGFFFLNTWGPYEKPSPTGQVVGGALYATPHTAVGASGFLLLDTNKWLPVLLEEIVIEHTPTPEASAFLNQMRERGKSFMEMLMSGANGAITPSTIHRPKN